MCTPRKERRRAARLGADTCYYFTALYNDQTGGYGDVMSLDHFKNLYCENEGGAHDVQMPIWEWDTLNSEMEDHAHGRRWRGLHRRGAAALDWRELQQRAAGAGDQFWQPEHGGHVTTLGQEPKGNVYSVNALINYGWGSDFNGTTSQSFSTPTGPYGYLQSGNSRDADPRADGGYVLYRESDPALYQHGEWIYFAGGIQRQLPD